VINMRCPKCGKDMEMFYFQEEDNIKDIEWKCNVHGYFTESYLGIKNLKEVTTMVGINWENIGEDFEKLEAFQLEVGKETDVLFHDDGKPVSKDEMKEAKFPRDAFVFVMEENNVKKNWWINQRDFSTLRQLREIRGEESLAGIRVHIKRISNSPKEQNWDIAVMEEV